MADEITTAVLTLVSQASKRDDITPDTRLDELGLDSLDTVDMLFALEERFNVDIPYNANEPSSDAYETIGDLIVAVGRTVVPRTQAA